MGFNVLPLIPLYGVYASDIQTVIPGYPNNYVVRVTADGLHFLVYPASGSGNQSWYILDFGLNLIYKNASTSAGISPVATAANSSDKGLGVYVLGSSVYWAGYDGNLYLNDNIVSVNTSTLLEPTAGSPYHFYAFCLLDNGLNIIASPGSNGGVCGIYRFDGSLDLTRTSFILNYNGSLGPERFAPTCINTLAYGWWLDNVGAFGGYCPNAFFSNETGFFTGGQSSTAYSFADLFSVGIRYKLGNVLIQMLCISPQYPVYCPLYFYVDGAPVTVSPYSVPFVIGSKSFPAISNPTLQVFSQRAVNGHPSFFFNVNGNLTLWGIGIDSSLHGVTSNYSRLF